MVVWAKLPRLWGATGIFAIAIPSIGNACSLGTSLVPESLPSMA